MDSNMLRDGVHVPEGTLDWTGSVERRRSTSEIHEIHRLAGARDGMPGRQPALRPSLDGGLASRDDVTPYSLNGVEQEEPRRAHQRLRLRKPSLRTPVLGQSLVRSFVPLPTSELDERLDGAPRNAQ